MKTMSHHDTRAPRKPERIIVAALLGLLAAIGPSSALADQHTARTNFFANMQKAGVTFADVTPATAQMVPTHVKGMYGIFTPAGKMISLTNDAGTLTTKGGGLSSVGLQAGKPIRLTPLQVNEVRAEVMANLDFDKMIKISYGNGGGRKILMFSAIDCPGCRMLEKDLAKAASSLNTTFYLVPSSLWGSDPAAVPALEKVAKIRCDAEPALAWQTFWVKRTLPAPKACALTPQQVERDFSLLFYIMDTVKAIKPVVPMLVAEDGKWIRLFRDMSPTALAAAFAAERKPNVAPPTTQWLAGASAGSKPALPVQPAKAR
ncbi:hypothetical protein F2P45_00320 [Massilia sp. CCM 8733]|uniref:Thioredoxin-like fold domain-containing protein n=1 Tax=Massilia mucilaginosa TaxID=2609282 RepID=A0ABX0NL10_9BURK|nr:hypothetical protein [Massilia mucilaginosa]NHZ87484.1 hypothetical protein [Massilia mucilaginosa]